MSIIFSCNEELFHARLIYNFDTFPNVISILFDSLYFDKNKEITLCRNSFTNTWCTEEKYELLYPEFFKKMFVPLEKVFTEAALKCQ